MRSPGKAVSLLMLGVAMMSSSHRARAQGTPTNLGFEQLDSIGNPVGWRLGVTKYYQLIVDSLAPYAGRVSLRSRWIDSVPWTSGPGKVGGAGLTLPVLHDLLQLARGRRLHLSVYIRTEGVTAGYAGLAMNVIDATARRTLATDDMSARGARGTTPWTRYDLELPVDSAATNVFITVIHGGNGTAWFDSLTIEVVGPAMPRAAEMASATVVPRPASPADTIRGGNTSQRAWWDATFYDLHVRVNPADSSIAGYNGITYRVLAPAQEMQIDLQAPLEVDSMIQGGSRLTWRRDSAAYFVNLIAPQRTGGRQNVTVYYHGKPVQDGTAFDWGTDSLGTPWIVTGYAGQVASAWWPLKDIAADEPDSQRIAITVPDPMLDVSNGRLRTTTHNNDGTTTFEWFVTAPIGRWSVVVNVSPRFVNSGDVFSGEKGPLSLDFWPLSYHLDTAKVVFQQVKTMLSCFEHWFGPYPWYQDGYKLIETPYFGMEHQSGIAYGNRYLPGYLGRDLSRTGLGLQWDYIIVHESAHEWWGNSLNARKWIDSWIREGFGAYAEGLYTECQQGKAAGQKYLVGTRNMSRDGAPGGMYFKGANMLMTIREVIDDDAKWRGMLRGLNQTFRHQTVTGQQVRDYMSRKAGVDLSRIFQQYLEKQVPVLEYAIEGATLSYRWSNVVPGFDMPVRVTLADSGFTRIRPTEAWQTAKVALSSPDKFRVDEVFYVTAKQVKAPGTP